MNEIGQIGAAAAGSQGLATPTDAAASPAEAAVAPVIGLWGIFGTRNLGNECTLHAMMEGARRHAPASRFLVICSQPADTRVRHGVDAVPITLDPESGLIRTRAKGPRVWSLLREIGDWARVIRTVRSLDHLMMPGTGLLTDSDESFLGTPYQLLKWTLAARLCGKPVSYVSVGAEALAHPIKSRFIGWALRLATYRSYRDEHSRERVRNLFAIGGTDPVYPDLAFSLPQTPARAGSRRIVAVGIYGLEGDAAAVAAYVEMIGQFLVHLLGRGYRPRVVYGDAEYDEAVRRQLLAWIQARDLDERVACERADSFEILMSQLAGCDMVVATRFHNIVLALLLGKPVISVSHMDKNDQLMEMTGLSQFVLPIAQATFASLASALARLEGSLEPVEEQIVQKTAQFRERLEVQYRELFGGASSRHGIRPGRSMQPEGR